MSGVKTNFRVAPPDENKTRGMCFEHFSETSREYLQN